jgi:hypothetical protein
MDDDDNGYIHYNSKYPPLFIAPAEPQTYDEKISMKGVVTNYLRDSYENGIKHPNTVLNAGITAGEAAKYHLVELHVKTNKQGSLSNRPNALAIIQKLMDIIETEMNIDMKYYEHIFLEYIRPDLFQSKNFDPVKLTHSLKAFLTRINKKDKGYTRILKSTIHLFIQNVYKQK